jgi:hypothetical protein
MMKKAFISAVLCSLLVPVSVFAAGDGYALRKGFSGFSTTGIYFHIHDTIDPEYGSFSGMLIPIGSSFGYSIGPAFFGAGIEYLAGIDDYESLASVYYESRFFFSPEATLSPCASICVGPHFLTDYVGVMVRLGGGVDYRPSKNYGAYAEFGYLGVLPDVSWAQDYSYWIGNVGVRAGVAAAF